jgi:hypothetical protein
MEAGVAVFEQIAVSTDKSLRDIREDLREMREDFREIRQDMKSMLGLGLTATATMLGLGLAATATLLGVLAHGFHWF